MTSFICFDRVSKRFPRCRQAALDRVSVSIPRGSCLAVLGANGAGKTTLLKLMATLFLPDRGTIRINGLNIFTQGEKLKKHIGFAADEERSFYWRLTGQENLRFFATLYGLDKLTYRRRTRELYTLFRVDYAHKRFDSYSSGMKKRFCLIRALLHAPDILLFDEPFKSLDYHTRHTLKEYIRNKTQGPSGGTVCISTHQVEEIEDCADTFLILDRGRLRAFGTLEELREQTGYTGASITGLYAHLAQNNHDR
ncbi:MAG: ABC transporter ATP-binding protein [Candidatus Omnitrophica bacterium]|nr:ABC transporter ATP-binding protein [Candidatus Omnitrophota bacterium]